MHAGHQPLRSGLLVSRRPIDLPGHVQSGHSLDLKTAAQSARIDMIILHGIAGHGDLHRFQPFNAAHHRNLHVGRQRCRNAVGIDCRVIQAFGFKKDLVPVTVAKTMDLVLDRGAVARPLRFDRPGKQWRAIEPGADNIVRARIGARDGAEYLWQRASCAQRRHRPGLGVTRLFGQARPINGATIEPWRRTGLQPRHRQFGITQLHGQAVCGVLTDTTTLHPFLATIETATQKCAGA